MKRIGIIGGIGPESTKEYYSLIIETFRKRISTSEYPEFVLYSVNMTEMLNYAFAGKIKELLSFLKVRINVLEDSNIDFAAMASNTPHIVFDELAQSVDVPMISIVNECCMFIAETGLKKVGLLGTKSTMTKGFYQKAGKKYGLEICIPDEAEQNFVHEKYMDELVYNKILPETKAGLVDVVHKLYNEKQIDGIILGGTELPLVLKQEDFTNIKIFNTTQIHVNAIVDRMLE